MTPDEDRTVRYKWLSWRDGGSPLH